MDHFQELERERAFLRDQLAQAEHKIARLRYAQSACTDCLEAEGLSRMLSVAQHEYELLNELLACQMSEQALSLDALVLQQLKHYAGTISRLSHGWQRGKPTPPDYWEAENKRGLLTGVMRRYHAWQHAWPNGRAYYAEPAAARALPGPNGRNGAAAVEAAVRGNGSFNPWQGAPGANHTSDEAAPNGDGAARFSARRDMILQRLAEQGFPADHLEVIVQPGGELIVTGYAHSAAARAGIIAVLDALPGVRDLLVDILVVKEAVCPACAAQRSR